MSTESLWSHYTNRATANRKRLHSEISTEQNETNHQSFGQRAVKLIRNIGHKAVETCRRMLNIF